MVRFKVIIFFILFLSMITNSWCQNSLPIISDINVSAENETITITYNLSDYENDDCYIELLVSDNEGLSYDINTSSAIGDINQLIATGSNKSITWDYSSSVQMSGELKIKLIANDQQAIDIQSIVDQVDSTILYNNLSKIVGIRHRNQGLAHLEDVRSLIEETYEEHQLNYQKETFDYGGFEGINYIGEIKGIKDATDVYILCGHYDSVSNSPGADDNATGVAGILEAIRLLSPYNFNKTIKFILFDLEEAGLKGSIDYVTNHIQDTEQILGVLDLEMIGYATDEPNTQKFPAGFNILFPEPYKEVAEDQFRGNFLANIAKVGQNEWENTFVNAANTYVPALKVITIVAPSNWQTITPDLGRSDHAPFWVSGRPAVMLTGTSNFRNPNYHTVNDTLGSINLSFLTNVVKATIATIAEQSEIQHSSSLSTSIEIDVNSTTMTKKVQNIISPNPSSGYITINTNLSSINNIQLLDQQGKLVQDNISTSKYIDISKNNPGIYFIKINTKTETIISKVVLN